ncbi:MAG: transcriptional regulator, partial [Geminicoccaceae bacterium]
TWNEEIGPIYPKTIEGRRAPLRRVDIHAARPDDLRDIQGVRFTPTFVLTDDRGREVGRINGYPGEDFFWGLLSELIAKLPNEAERDPLTSI